MSVASAKRSTRACHARSTSASISAWSSSWPRPSASARVISGGTSREDTRRAGRLSRARDASACRARDASAVLPPRLALLAERAHSLAEVLGGEGRAAQVEQLLLDLGIECCPRGQHCGDHPL